MFRRHLYETNFTLPLNSSRVSAHALRRLWRVNIKPNRKLLPVADDDAGHENFATCIMEKTCKVKKKKIRKLNMEASNFGGKQERCRQSTKHGFVRSKVILFIAPTEPRTRWWQGREKGKGAKLTWEKWQLHFLSESWQSAECIYDLCCQPVRIVIPSPRTGQKRVWWFENETCKVERSIKFDSSVS